MALAYIDDTGIHLPDYPTVLDHVKGVMHDIYGDDLYIEADSQDGGFRREKHETRINSIPSDRVDAIKPYRRVYRKSLSARGMETWCKPDERFELSMRRGSL